MSDLLPNGKVLEIGYGIGLGTYYLSQNHDVLSLDNNQYFINKATQYLNVKKCKYTIHKCDILNMTSSDLQIIQEFKPEIIVAWFIGSAGEDVNTHIYEKTNLAEKVKLYRERIEDLIVSKDIVTNSVKTINFALRGMTHANISDEVMYIDQKQNYDTYVFHNTGFEVTDVKSIKWDIDKSGFRYSTAHNPHFSKVKEVIPVVISIIAEKSYS